MIVEFDTSKIKGSAWFSRALALSMALGTVLVSGSALACSAASWIETSPSSIPASLLGRPRYEEACGFKPTTLGQYVLDNMTDDFPADAGSHPGGVTQYEASFYAFTRFNPGATTSNEVTIFQGLYNTSATTSPDVGVSVSVRAGATREAVLTLSAGATSVSDTVTIGTTSNLSGWAFFHLSWDKDGNTMLTVNDTNSVTIPTPAGTQNLQSHRVGWLAGNSANLATNGLAIDSFASFTETGDASLNPRCPGDVNASGSRTVDDARAIFVEFVTSGNTPVTVGQPDFDGDGDVDINDARGTFVAFISNNSACPSF